jgi:hypothetical protein
MGAPFAFTDFDHGWTKRNGAATKKGRPESPSTNIQAPKKPQTSNLELQKSIKEFFAQ